MRRSFRSQNVLLITVSLLIVLACSASAFAMFGGILFDNDGDYAFCKPNDRVYLAFKNNLDDFKAFFPSISTPYTVIAKTFDVPGEQPYVVRADYFSSDAKAPILYVPVLEAYSPLTSGIEGYLYAPTLSDFWKTNYKLTSLGGNFYCYGN